MLHTIMTTNSFLLSELFLLDGFICDFVSALLQYPLKYFHDTSQNVYDICSIKE